MTEKELYNYLNAFFAKEDEKCEWKAFTHLKNLVSGNSGDDVISYVSAFSNMEGGVLIMGVEDKTLKILGIKNTHDFTPDNLPPRILGNTTNLPSEGLKVEEFITSDSGKKVWVLNIPKHSPRRPVYAHKKAWQRSGDSLIELSRSREDAILKEPLSFDIYDDWSAQLCPTAAITDLDSRAIEVAKANFKIKHPKINEEEINEWSISTFLAKSKLLVNNTLTNAAILLLGKPESIAHIHPILPQITWVLYDEKKREKDYEHFFLPFVIAIDEVFRKIRILKYRYLKEGTLFPEEVDQYDQGSIKEALSNCIAHMDYTISGRITVSENEDGFISFSNLGSFLPGSVERVIKSDEPPSIYRNGLLVRAMAGFNMIDSIGSGIKRMFEEQRHRFFPMPEYDISENKVKVTLTGKVLNLDYARVLAKRPDLTLEEIIMLDKLAQKKVPLNMYEIQILKAKGLIEGRKPNFHISAFVAEKTEQKADYINTKGLDDNHYKNLVEEYLRTFKKGNRAEIERVLLPKLPGILSEPQKQHKIKNLLQAMKKEGRIEVDDNRYWILSKK